MVHSLFEPASIVEVADVFLFRSIPHIGVQTGSLVSFRHSH